MIPDGTFALAELDVFRDAEPWMRVEPEGIAMVVEVTSSRPEPDRKAKRYGYARASIPFYLLVDREERTTTLFSDPERGDYRHVDSVSFGKTLALPEPFGVDLDTSEFA
ncbi:Uma2 family endonuclease [Actinomadura sp. LOL_016]|uniref:Uma2 family endonuclease n=1 Tax=unclassified Actinomadura TaxID=2626254 RepID=UPI003A7F78F8